MNRRNPRQSAARIRKGLCALAAALLTAGCLPVSAASGDSYVLDGSRRVPVPSVYEVETAWQTFRTSEGEVLQLYNPQDLFISTQGYLYIVDTGNNRILRSNSEGMVDRIYTGPEEDPFKNPGGVFVDKDGDLYVADTDNSRIVHLDSDGGLMEVFGVPEELPGENTTYHPAKLAISSTGYIYVVNGQNILTIDATNRFRGYLGQTKIGFDLTETLIRLFASEEQQKTLSKRLAASYTNIVIDPDDNLYASTLDSRQGEIKRLNSVGVNTFPATGSESRFSIDFSQLLQANTYISASGTAFYGDRTDDEGKAITPNFVDIAYDEDGVVYALDQNTCRMFLYDREGNLLGTFGEKGIQKGMFVQPVSLAVDPQGTVYILDVNLCNIQVLKPTRFKNLVQQAITAYYLGDYDGSFTLWSEVLAIDENYTLASQDIGKTYYKQGDYPAAMKAFRQAGDTGGYSDAFEKNLYQLFRSHFALALLLILLALAALCAAVWAVRLSSKRVLLLHEQHGPRRASFLRTLQLTTSAMCHPCETFDNIKAMRQEIRVWPAFVLAAAAPVVRILYMHIVHYPLADIDLRMSSYVLEIVKILLPFFTFVISAYAVTAIMDGETKFKELLLCCACALTPYTFLTLPLAGLSHILTGNSAGLYSTLQTIILVWVLLLLFHAVRISNQFSFKKTLAVVLISLLVMLLIWILGFLILVLWNQVVLLFSGLLTELGI